MAVTVNGDRYRAMLIEFLFTKIEKEDIGNIWNHIAEVTLDVLRPVFEDRIISCRASSELRFDNFGLLFVECRQG